MLLRSVTVAALAGLIVAGSVLAAQKPIALTWDQLVPEDSGGPDYTRVSPFCRYKGLMSDEAGPAPVVDSLEGRGVRLSG